MPYHADGGESLTMCIR